MKEIGYIYTANNGEYLSVWEGGFISRQEGKVPSGQWRVLGAIERNNFGNVVRRYSLEELLQGGIQWTPKNGAQKVFLRDNDHGGIREWRGGHFFSVTGKSGPAQYPTPNGLARSKKSY